MSARALLLALILLSGAGCHHAPGADEGSELADPDATITIRVVNHSQLDATIYLSHDGVRERLGAVTAATAGTFGVRRRMLAGGDFALLADPVGSNRTGSSERLVAAMGTLFIWTLESDFAHNSVQVRD
jgi:hypothetical protein